MIHSPALPISHIDVTQPEEPFDGARLAQPAPPPPMRTLTLDFLEWIASTPRTYRETMEAWRTSCPRFTIWEDAFDDGLVQLERESGARLSTARVVLTERGQQAVESRR